MAMHSEKRDLVMQLKNGDKNYSVLVSGASGIVGYGILRCLKERDDCYLIGTTIYDISPANCFSDIVEIVPPTNAPEYIDVLLELIKKYSVDMLIPGIEADMSFWNENRDILQNTGATLLINNQTLINLCLDKYNFYKCLEENNYAGRINSSIVRDFNVFCTPFLLKPRRGFGSRGIIKISNRDEFDLNSDKIGYRYMQQEYVGTDDEEYTVSAFFDIDSNLKAVIAMKRKLYPEGYTGMAEVVDKELFLDELNRLAEIFAPVGPADFQFRLSDNKLKLLEINPRISSSTSIRAKFGYNESSMAIDYFLSGKEIIQPEIRKGRAIRYTEDFIFYDSDYV